MVHIIGLVPNWTYTLIQYEILHNSFRDMYSSSRDQLDRGVQSRGTGLNIIHIYCIMYCTYMFSSCFEPDPIPQAAQLCVIIVYSGDLPLQNISVFKKLGPNEKISFNDTTYCAV